VRRPDPPWLPAILARESRLAFRGATFWALAAAGGLLAAWRAAIPHASSATAAFRASEAILLGLGLLAIFLAASAAALDRRQSVTQLVLAKPHGSRPSLVLVRFAAVWLSLAALAAIMLAAASLAQVAVGGTAWHLSPYVHALARTILPIGLAAALGFSLSTIFATPLASAVAAIYWIVIPLTRPHTAVAFDLTLSQHWPMAAFLTAFLLVLTAALYARPIRDRGPGTARLAWTGAILLIAAGAAAYRVAAAGDDALLGPDPVLAAIASQSCRTGPRAPGFWLPDARGRLLALSDYAGRPAVIAFWGPAVSESARYLSSLRELTTGLDSSGITRIAICVDPDPAAMRPFRQDAGPSVVMLWDRGRHFGEGGYWDDSPTAVAYEVTALPTTFILDRRCRLVRTIQGDVSLDRLRAEVTRVLER